MSEVFDQFDWPHLVRINQIRYYTDKIICRFKIHSSKYFLKHPPLDLDRVELLDVWQRQTSCPDQNFPVNGHKYPKVKMVNW